MQKKFLGFIIVNFDITGPLLIWKYLANIKKKNNENAVGQWVSCL